MMKAKAGVAIIAVPKTTLARKVFMLPCPPECESQVSLPIYLTGWLLARTFGQVFHPDIRLRLERERPRNGLVQGRLFPYCS
jgi:hypothetical protein